MRPGPCAVAFSLLVAAGCAAPGRHARPGRAAAKLPAAFDVPAIDAYIAGRVAAGDYVGLSLAVVRDGELVLVKGYGKRSLDRGTPVTTETPFAIGSVTKQLTCGVVLALAEDHALSPRDPVAKYFPALTRAADVTLYDTLTHMSGYPDFYPLDFLDDRMRRPVSPDEVISRYAGGALDFEPGTRWSYSNTGFMIAARAAEKASGKSFAELLAARVFRPLGMERSSFGPGAGAATGYTSFALGEPEPAESEADGWLYAAGGVYSTAADLARWDLALMSGGLLSPASLELMTTPRQRPDGRSTRYGCGLSVRRDSGETVLQHGGAVSGFLAHNVLVPRTRSAVVLLSNTDYADPTPLAEEILALLLHDEPGIPRVSGPPPQDVALRLFRQLQAGAIDRSLLGADFSAYLEEAKLAAAAPRLARLGEPVDVELVRRSERGGMEVSRLLLHFRDAALAALLYRTPDGKVQELLLQRR